MLRFAWTSHVTLLHEVLNEKADSIHRFRRLDCYVLANRNTHGAGEARMRGRDPIKFAGALVLASD